MKYAIKRKMAIVLLAVLPQSIEAQGYLVSNSNSDDDTTTDNTTYVTNQSTVNNVVVDQLKTDTIEKSLEQGKRFKSGGANGYAGAQYIYADKVRMFNIPLGMDVGYGFGIEANVPVVFAKKEISGTGKDEEGLGDISGGFYYHFGTPSSSGLSILSFLYKSTSGDENKGLGSGADAYSVSYKYARRFNGRYTWHLLGSYTLNNDYTDQYGAQIEYGDAYMAMIGGSMPCLISDKVTTSAKLTYFHADETTEKDSWGEWKYGETDVTDLWIQWDSAQLLSGIPLGLGIKIPLQNRVKNGGMTINPDKKFSFYVSIAGLF